MDLARIEEAFTSRRWRWILTDHRYEGWPLRRFLEQHLPHIDPSSWPERFAIGGVYVNGLMREVSTPIEIPSKIEYYEPRVPLHEIASTCAPFSSCRILFEDQYIAVVWKPDRLSCMPGKEQQQYNLKTYLEGHYRSTIHMPSRLDMSTRGIVVISRDSRCHRLLQQLFEKRRIAKYYLLASQTVPTWRYRWVSNFIERDPRHAVLRRVAYGRTGSHAETLFRRIGPIASGAGNESALVMARPATGRTHQIRVHAAFLGMPITGDRFYGGAPGAHLHLVSYRLAFSHPFTGAFLDIRAPQDLLPEWAHPALTVT